MTKPLLDVRTAVVRFGGVTAVDHANLEVAEGSIHALIGPNGAGKTTLLNAISGLVPLTAGEMIFEGNELSTRGPQFRAKVGIVRTFQNPALIDSLSIRENVQTGMFSQTGTTVLEEVLSLPRARGRERLSQSRADAALSELGIELDGGTPVSALPLGLRKVVDIARAFVASPKLLLLDEPTAGLDDDEIDVIEAALDRLKRRVTIVLIAHHLDFVMRLADEVTVLEFGKVIANGDPNAVRNDPAVISAYIGSEE